MAKRTRSSTCSPQEAKQFSQIHYDKLIQDTKKEKLVMAPVHRPDLMELPENTRIRPCWSCDCTNAKGYCDNYFLYAVLRDRCRMLVKEVV